jgi:hypothetical protein
MRLSLYFKKEFIDHVNIPAGSNVSIETLKLELIERNRKIINDDLDNINIVLENIPPESETTFKSTLDHYDEFMKQRKKNEDLKKNFE